MKDGVGVVVGWPKVAVPVLLGTDPNPVALAAAGVLPNPPKGAPVGAAKAGVAEGAGFVAPPNPLPPNIPKELPVEGAAEVGRAAGTEVVAVLEDAAFTAAPNMGCALLPFAVLELPKEDPKGCAAADGVEVSPPNTGPDKFVGGPPKFNFGLESAELVVAAGMVGNGAAPAWPPNAKGTAF